MQLIHFIFFIFFIFSTKQLYPHLDFYKTIYQTINFIKEDYILPRKARTKSTSNIYHVVIRGADRQQIFEEAYDHKKYLDILKFYKEECNFEIFAYCLMSNHIHLLIHTPNTPIDTVFRRINTRYAVWFNMKYNRTGFLQQGRYYSEPVEDYKYLMNVVRYIHQNPYNAGLEQCPGAAYPWSSIYSYLTNDSSLVDIDFISKLFNSRENFIDFHNKTSETKCLDIDNIKRRLPDDVAKQIIFDETGCSTATEFQSLSLLECHNNLIRLHEKGLSVRQLNRLTGISKGVIDRTLSKGHSS